jgi:hypothetical protein
MNGNKLLLEEEINNCIYQIFQLRLEEKVRENAGLTRQLENALTDLRRQSENVRDKQGQKVWNQKFNDQSRINKTVCVRCI